jgi:hypothetical protein
MSHRTARCTIMTLHQRWGQASVHEISSRASRGLYVKYGSALSMLEAVRDGNNYVFGIRGDRL